MSWGDEQGRTRDPYARETPAPWWTREWVWAAFWVVCLLLVLLLTPGSV